MGAVLGESRDGVVASGLGEWVCWCCRWVGTDMPEVAPVTMYTLPVRSGRESG